MPPLARFRNGLAQSLLGGTDKGPLTTGLPDRTFERGQGCWNCINAQSPVDRWLGKDKDGKRGEMLARATRLSLNHPKGEKSEKVVQIRRAIEMIDRSVGLQLCFVCTKGVTEDGEPVGDFVASTFLCKNWSGRDGASLARAADGKLDDLPGELRDKIDGSGPMSVSDLINKAQGEQP